jgi:5'-nucleotidase
MSKISIAHFNDVYRVSPQKFAKSSSETIDVSKFGGLLDSVRAQWQSGLDGKSNGLTLFSGDAFSPSMESSVTRGDHMVGRSYSCAPTTKVRSDGDPECP